MLFNSFIFLCAFLPVTYVVFWLLTDTRPRYVWLTVTGYVFYGYWNPRFVLLMAFSTLVSYFAGLGFLRWSDDRRRRLCLVVPIVVRTWRCSGSSSTRTSVMHSADTVVRLFGLNVAMPHLDVILPIGISFYTFHTITYIVDSYRRRDPSDPECVRVRRVRVAVFTTGRGADRAVPRRSKGTSSRSARAIARAGCERGLAFFVIGLVEKVVIADSLAAIRRSGADDVRRRCRPAARGSCSLGYTLPAVLRFLRLQRHGGRPRTICSACGFRRTSTHRTRRSIHLTSGVAGTSRCRRVCATISTFRLAAAAEASGRPTEICS